MKMIVLTINEAKEVCSVQHNVFLVRIFELDSLLL